MVKVQGAVVAAPVQGFTGGRAVVCICWDK